MTKPTSENEPDLGICLSGGGVRSASFSLGVLQVLDAQGLYDDAKWLTSVSGGSYMAGAWTIARRGTPPDVPPPCEPWADDSPEETHLRRHLNYLFAREGGTTGAVATLIVGVTINIVTLATILWLVVRPIGWLIGSPLLTNASRSGSTIDFAVADRRYWMPVAIWGVVSCIAFVAWVIQRRVASLGWPLTGSSERHVVRLLAVGTLGLTALLAFFLVVAPAAAAALPRLMRDYQGLARAVQTIAAGGVVAIVFSVIRAPLSRVLPRMGGLLVVGLAVIAGSEIAARAARNGPTSDELRTWAIVLIVFCVWYYAADPDWWSLQPYYRGRLREAYATERIAEDGVTTVRSLEPADEPDLHMLGQSRPQLVVCTAMNVSTGAMQVGVPAYSFTFDPERVVFHVPNSDGPGSSECAVGTVAYAGIYKRWDTPRLTPITAVGISGAAVSSAMGRQNRGSTNALLTLANIRLGAWMPNPQYISGQTVPDKPGYHARRISYLLKELFAQYDPDDVYLYLTDGGHWENLGLVELIRRGCTEMVCADASGADASSHATIAEAITLAAQECDAKVEIELEPMRAAVSEGVVARFAPDACAVGLVHYADGTQGLLWYVKCNLVEDATSRLLAFKEKNDSFPCDPTTNQLFTTEKFECYRLLGVDVGEMLLRRREQLKIAARAAAANAWSPAADAAPFKLITDAVTDPTLRAHVIAP